MTRLIGVIKAEVDGASKANTDQTEEITLAGIRGTLPPGTSRAALVLEWGVAYLSVLIVMLFVVYTLAMATGVAIGKG